MIPDKINNVTPIKDNKQDWFDNEIADALKIREKYFKKVKKTNLQIDYNFYIEAKIIPKN